MKVMGYALLFILFLILRYLYNSTKNEDEKTDTLEPVNDEIKNKNGILNNINCPESNREPLSLIYQVVCFLNNSNIDYEFGDKENLIYIKNHYRNHKYRIDIHAIEMENIIVYRIILMYGFPDDRLHKMMELILRLNALFINGHFKMFIESRAIVFDIPMLVQNNIVDQEQHDDNIDFLLNTFIRFGNIFYRVAFENEEPLLEVLAFT
jgi:hypothetical protein